MNESLPQEHAFAAPPTPDAASLDRVRIAARSRASSRKSSRRGLPSLRLAASVAVTAAVIGAMAWVMTPRFDDSAFARQQAVAALLPREGVLHTESTLTWEATGIPKQTIPGEGWICVDEQAARDVELSHDGEVAALTIRRDTLVRSLGRDGGIDEKTGKPIPGSYRIVQYDAPEELTSPGGGYVDVLREGLETGKAEVIDRQTIDGDEYWIVKMHLELSDKATGDSSEDVRATMRVGDYRLRELTIHREGEHPVDGKRTEDVSLRFSTWETVSRASLPMEFFDPAEVDKAAPKGTIVEVPLEED